MQKITIPCGQDEVSFKLPENIEGKLIYPNKASSIENVELAIREAIYNPIATNRISQLVKHNATVAIIVTDTTRKLPEDIIVPILLDELELAGVKLSNVTVVNAVGKHEPNTVEELTQMLGKEVMKRVKVINSDSKDPKRLKSKGLYKGKYPIVANDIVVDADVRIATGVIEPHLLAGYSGGVKTLSIGVAGLETIACTHSARMLDNPKTRLGVIEGNAFRKFLMETAGIIGLDFIVNVVQNGQKELLGVFAGDPIKAFEKGVMFARSIYETKIKKKFDVVISAPAYPKSSNLYQATRAWNNVIFGPQPVVKKGGTIIIPTPCEQGVGEPFFYSSLAAGETPKQVLDSLRMKGFKPGEHKAFLTAKVLNYANVVITHSMICICSSRQSCKKPWIGK